MTIIILGRMTWARGVTKTTPPGHFPGPTLSSLYEACPEYYIYWE